MKKIKIGNLGKDLQLFNKIFAKDRAIQRTIDRLINQSSKCEFQYRGLLYKHTTKEQRDEYDSICWDDETGELFGTIKESFDDYQEAFVKELVDTFTKKICEPTENKKPREEKS